MVPVSMNALGSLVEPQSSALRWNIKVCSDHRKLAPTVGCWAGLQVPTRSARAGGALRLPLSAAGETPWNLAHSASLPVDGKASGMVRRNPSG